MVLRPAMIVTLRAVIRIRGVNPYILVSRASAGAIRPTWAKPLPVVVRLHAPRVPTLRTRLMPVGNGTFYLYLPGWFRHSTGTTVGDRIAVDLQFDRAYRGGPQERLPRWFSSALRTHGAAADAWRALPPSRKKEIVRYFSRLQSSEARDRNLRRVLRVLAGRAERFMGRDWVDGS